MWEYLTSIMKYPKDQSKKDPKTLGHFFYLTGQVKKLKVHNLLFCGEALGFGENFVSQLAGSILFHFCLQNCKECFVSGTLFTKHYACTVVKPQFLEEAPDLKLALNDVDARNYIFEVLLMEALINYAVLEFNFSYEEASSKLGFLMQN